ncbi:hypothetical protein, variant 1 [Aphanomyces invadans]|uniref:Uncharacterized protein n=1 Tax=Aphanomyces invadans TaxID=157072 RepID=A0A024TN96_9STRA|nr:hypothetical protein, variant 1 [Aphanomyces invadans]ETV95106.1 hypothetical protein, variant 1 [Aphanomyces invadans]|eukprot:XP_008876281.1 hypothetical protein, variant 1 [Aphanomyces invadans]
MLKMYLGRDRRSRRRSVAGGTKVAAHPCPSRTSSQSRSSTHERVHHLRWQCNHRKSPFRHVLRYLRAMDKLSTREEIAAEAIAALHDDMKKNTLRNDRARRELAHIIHMHDTMRNMAEEREITENSSMFKHWSRDCEEKERHYAQEIERCNAELRSRRFPLDESLEHHTLVSLAEDCASIEASTYDLAAQLSFYRALPSTVMEAQRALEAMEAEFTHEAADGVESS